MRFWMLALHVAGHPKPLRLWMVTESSGTLRSGFHDFKPHNSAEIPLVWRLDGSCGTFAYMAILDRRESFRQRGWFSVRVATTEGSDTTVAHDVSESGLLMVSSRPLETGDPVYLALHVDPANEAPWMLGGTVVRSTPNTADPEGLWPHKVAVTFNDRFPELVKSAMAAS